MSLITRREICALAAVMPLGFIADRYGEEEAQRIAGFTEYRRIADPSDDPFAI